MRSVNSLRLTGSLLHHFNRALLHIDGLDISLCSLCDFLHDGTFVEDDLRMLVVRVLVVCDSKCQRENRLMAANELRGPRIYAHWKPRIEREHPPTGFKKLPTKSCAPETGRYLHRVRQLPYGAPDFAHKTREYNLLTAPGSTGLPRSQEDRTLRRRPGRHQVLHPSVS